MQTSRIGLIGAAVVAGALALGTIGSAFAQQAPGGPGWGPGGMMGGWGPGAGQAQPGTGYGPGGGYGPGYGPGMMGGGYPYGPRGMMGGYGYGYGPGQQATPMASLDDAKAAFQRYVDATGDKNLALDEVMQFQLNFYAIVKDTSTGTGAFELLADPRTGYVSREPGPDMMWNTQYGMMAGYWGQPAGQPSVSADQARQIAQQWLDANQPGSGTEAPDAFPGYYTLHITKDGTITGMLSVNAYTGAVWYHTWHGAFVASTEVSG